jgi:hypothetical protein
MTVSPFIRIFISMAGILLIKMPSIAASNSVPVCPPEIQQSSVALRDVEDGWTSYVATPLYLHSVAAIDGPPERLGSLIAKQVRSGRNTWVDTYDLRGPFPEGKWLQCGYGMLNEIVLAKRLNDDIATCTIKGRKGEKAGQNVFSVECR